MTTRYRWLYWLICWALLLGLLPPAQPGWAQAPSVADADTPPTQHVYLPLIQQDDHATSVTDDVTPLPQAESEDGVVDDGLVVLESAGTHHTPTCDLYPIALYSQTLAAVAPGTLIKNIVNGSAPGNFGWLTWNGKNSVAYLVASLTPPGNAHTYRNPNDRKDHQVSVGDWVQGQPGLANSKAIRNALDVLKRVDITIPIWGAIQYSGANAQYQITNFALVRLIDYQLPRQNQISVRFLGYNTHCGQPHTPVAVADAYNTDEDTPLAIAAPGVLSNDTDDAHHALKAIQLGDITHLTLDESGAFSYTPAPNFFGIETFYYKATDSIAQSQIATITITIKPVNDAPVATDDQATTSEATPVIIPVLANDRDVDGDPLTITQVGTAALGLAVAGPGQMITYTPAPQRSGSDHFIYTICDPGARCATATVTVVIGGVNDRPIANDDQATTPEDTPVTINVAANDSDPDGNLLPGSVITLTNPISGVVASSGNGSFIYTPHRNFFGLDHFRYTICDDGTPEGIPLCTSATVTITVTPVNDPPLAFADHYTATEDLPLTVTVPGVLLNDQDVDGDTLTVRNSTQPVHGALLQNPDGSFIYTPADDYCGSDSYSYTLSDGRLEASGQVTLAITCVNDPPLAQDDVYTMNEAEALTVNAPGILHNDSDPDGDPLVVQNHTQPAHGVLTQHADGALVYTPQPNFCGADSYQYTVVDGNGGSAEAAVALAIICVNSPPVAVDDSYTVNAGQTLIVPEPGVLGNDSDPDNDQLTVLINALPAHGVLDLHSDGSFTYTPTLGFSGTDTFTYRANDGALDSNIAIVHVTINPPANTPIPPTNTPIATETPIPPTPTPQVENCLVSLDFGEDGVLPSSQGFTYFASTPTITERSVFSVSNGLLHMSTLQSRGVVRYQLQDAYDPTLDFVLEFRMKVNSGTGLYGLDFEVSDNIHDYEFGFSGNSIGLPPPRQVLPFIATDDFHTYRVFSSAGTNTYQLFIDNRLMVSNTLSLNGDPGQWLMFGDSISDTDGSMELDFIRYCQPSNNAVHFQPLAFPDTYVMFQGQPLRVSAPGILANDSNPNGGLFTAVADSSPINGTLTLQLDGSFIYTPTNGFSGSDTFTYHASDGYMNSNTAAVNIDILTPVPPGPPTWHQLFPKGPAPTPRFYLQSGSAYDEVNDRLMIFGGGSTEGRLADVWVLVNATETKGLSSWLQLTPSGSAPNARDLHSAVYDPSSNRLIIYGGCGGNCGPFYGDVWVLTNANGLGGTPTWLPLPTAPRVSNGQAAVYDVSNNRMIIFGGATSLSSDTNEVQVLLDANGIGNPTWLQLTPIGTPPPVRGATAATVYDPSTNRLMVIAGRTNLGKVFNDAWVLTNANGLGGTPQWIQLNPTGTLPAPRGGHALVYDPTTNRVILFAGQDDQVVSYYDDVWILTNANGLGGTPEWVHQTPAGTLPLSRYIPIAGYSVSANRLVVTSGYCISINEKALNDVWLLTNANALYTAGNLPTAPSRPCRATPPVAQNDTYNADADLIFAVPAPGILGNDADADGDRLTAVLDTPPAHGTLTLRTDGLFTYTPNQGFVGVDSFTYHAHDGYFDSNVATVTINEMVPTPTPTPTTISTPTATATNTPTPSGPPPTVSITSPAEGDRATTLLDIIGTADSPTLASYKLEYRPADDAAWTTFATATTAVVNGALGKFDPTLLLNGIYEIRLTAVDTTGQFASVSTKVVVEGQAKVGNFTLSFTDLNVPVAGIPIQVIRTYDSRDKHTGDFGVGWTLDIKNVHVQENKVLGQDWQGTVSGGFIKTYCIVPARPNVVTVTLPDGAVFRFAPTLSPNNGCQQITWLDEVTFGFSPLPGTNAALVPIGDNTAIVNGDFPGTVELLDIDSATPTDFDRYQLVLPDGRTLALDQVTGLESITDLNHNTLTVTAAGITHSSGEGVTFTRDAQNRITRITDPVGNAVNYTYDANGDLVKVTDPVGNATTFTYNSSHYLLDIKDPRGVQAIRNEYDSNGRLIRHIDVDGKVISYTHNITASQEIVVNRLGDQTAWAYDARGNVVKQTDALGKVTTYTYDSRDNTLSETDPLSRTTTYTYDAQDNLLRVTDPRGKTTEYTYNSRGQVLTTRDPLGHGTINGYDANGNLTSTTDPLGKVTTYTYDAQGNQLSVEDALHNITRYEYDSAGHMTKEIDALGHATVYTYDANGNRLTETMTRTTSSGVETLLTSYTYDGLNRLIKTTYPDGSTTQTEYNNIGQQSKTIDQLGHATTYEYDLAGRLIRTTYPDNSAESTTYDAEGRRASSTDRGGHTTTFTYDALGRLTRTTYADDTFSETTYDDAGQVSATTDERSNVTRYAYDTAGRRAKVIDALDHTTSFGYNDAGNQTSMTDANQHTITYQYDANNRRVRTIYADNSTQVTDYDVLGRRIAETDQAGKQTQFAYDALGRLIKVTDALNQATTYTYDEQGNQLTQTDANLHTTTFAYDKLGRRVRRTLPLGMAEIYAYDAAGNLISKTDFNGKTTTYSYDNANRLTAKTPDASLGQPAITFSYFANGQRQRMGDASGVTTYTYDARDRLLTKATGFGTLTYTYDAAGNLASTRSSNANGVSVGYSYDALNRLATVTDNRLANGVTTYSYDNAGNLASYRYPNSVQHSYTYDSLNRLTDLTVNHGATSLARYTYSLGPTGNRLAVAELSGRTVNYTYDSLYRLTGETIAADPNNINGAIGYTYDPVGNRLTRTSTVPPVPATTYGYDNNDRLTSDTYDASGNTIASSGNTYAYDFENHLTNFNNGAATYVYDGDGNRVAKTVGGVTTNYLVDDRNPTGYAQVLEEIVGSAVIHQYTYGSDLISQDQLISGVWMVSFYGYDGHGSVRFLSDTTGVVTDRYDYDAFGSVISSNKPERARYLYSGEQFDNDIGLYYLRARYYKDQSGRFFTSDNWPGNNHSPSSLHKYVYAEENPVNINDPSGRFSIVIAVATAILLDVVLTSPVNKGGDLTLNHSAWPQKSQWNAVDISDYRDFVKNYSHLYEGMSIDCADLALTLLINFASTHGLPVRLSTDNRILDSRYADKISNTPEKFLIQAKAHINARIIYQKNTSDSGLGTVPSDIMKAQAADMMMYEAPLGRPYTGHTTIFLERQWSIFGDSVTYISGHMGGSVITKTLPAQDIPGEEVTGLTSLSLRWWTDKVFGK